MAVEPKTQPFLAEADAPGVVVRAAEELELRAVGLEPEEALAEVVPLAADRRRRKPE